MATYDANLHVYLTSLANPLGHTTSYFYYCINEAGAVCSTPNPIATLKAVRDPNSDATGSIQTLFDYNRLSQLIKVYRPGNVSPNPTQEYVYSDASATGTAVAPPLKITTRQYSAAGVYVFMWAIFMT